MLKTILNASRFNAKLRTISVCSLSNTTNRRITRLENETELIADDIQTDAISKNDLLHEAKLENRNPRNLEQLQFEVKPLGWELDNPRRIYWNKVVLQKSGKYLDASIIHYSGRVVVSASTKESAIMSELYSTSDTNAAINIGRILARRCLESGVTNVFREESVDAEYSYKLKAFYEALEAEGLTLSEPHFILPRRYRDL